MLSQLVVAVVVVVVSLVSPAVAATSSKTQFFLRRGKGDSGFRVEPFTAGSAALGELGALANNDSSVLAFGSVEETLHEAGWDRVEFGAPSHILESNATYGYYAAGYLEGYTTMEGIYNNYINLLVVNLTTKAIRPTDAKAQAFVQEHIEFLRKIALDDGTATLSPTPPEGYVEKLQHLLSQLDGMLAGYNDRVAASGDKKYFPLSFYELFLMSYHPELADVDMYVSEGPTSKTTQQSASAATSSLPQGLRPAVSKPRCSALIKPVFDDLFVSHATWANYNYMYRQYKQYTFETTVVMSSYPAGLSSSDDWYMTSNGLAVQETSLLVFNGTLYREHFTAKKISAFLRTMISNYLANNGSQWQQMYVSQNSGSYNNQWMVVDMKLFQPCTAIADFLNLRADGTESACNVSGMMSVPDEFLWVSETLPGHAVSADVSHVVRRQGYWASYNIPYFASIFQLSGNAAMEAEYGSYFNHHDSYRAEIFRRNQTQVRTLADMKAIMRYNNYRHDPLADIPNCTGTIYGGKCHPKRSAMLQIAARGDLDPVGHVDQMGPLANPDVGINVGQQGMGAIDAKIATWSNFKWSSQLLNNTAFNSGAGGITKTWAVLKGVAISGPTAVQQPPFDYRTTSRMISEPLHLGLPSLWDFDWIDVTSVSLPVEVTPPVPEPAYKKVLVPLIVGIAGAVVLALNVFIIIGIRRGPLAPPKDDPNSPIRPSPKTPSAAEESTGLIQSAA